MSKILIISKEELAKASLKISDNWFTNPVENKDGSFYISEIEAKLIKDFKGRTLVNYTENFSKVDGDQTTKPPKFLKPLN